MKRFLLVGMLLIATVLGVQGIVEARSVNRSKTASEPSQSGIYVALGDSIAAGAGLGGSGGCMRATQSYPYIVAQEKGLQLVHLACSGATTDNVLSQLDSAFTNGVPELITLTVGANDANWDEILRQCYTSDCATDANATAVKERLAVYEKKLDAIFGKIEEQSTGQPPRVVVTGYSNPVSNYCIGRQDYATKQEIKWLNNRRDDLNKTIRSVAGDYKFVRYASTNFNDHALCAKETWVQQLTDPAPLHPNALGQDHIAASVLKSAR